ncbi:MAG: hypothetical protein JSS20_19395 [Proteobacteria bacterium]|nr:hypothetical protein [Pseudomonadota bacterium]
MSKQHRSAETEILQPQLNALRISLRLEQIARECLGIPNLSQRGEVELDFYELHVTNIREGLKRAFDAGRYSANNQ